MYKWPGNLVMALGLAAAVASTVQAELSAVDPGPYTAATGNFPRWYEDADGLALELCQSKALSSRAAAAPGTYMCTLNAVPGVFDDTLPMVFPNNFPSELFWFLAETSIPATGNSGYELEVYVAALEGAFALELPAAGDQQSFARIRIRASVPVAGTYTITHPYGVDTVQVTTPGRRAINITRDIGIGAPGDFGGALTGDIGPFLQSVNGPYTETNPDTGIVETFVGDPNLTEAVTGSPNNTNFVRIEGPAGTIETNLFVVSGKVLDSRPATPVEVERSSYSRTATQTRIEVFATAPADATLCFRETLELVDGTPPSPCLIDLIGDNGYFFAHDSAPQTLPPFVVVTATHPTGITQPTSVSSPLRDIVKIASARFSWDDRRLTVQASSSDQLTVPDLLAQGFGRLSKAGSTQTLTVDNLPQPPASITVKSAAGGSDTEPVTIVGSPPLVGPNQPPLAIDDNAATSAGVPVTIGVLANDSDPDNDTPLSVVELTQPASGQGNVALNGSTSVIYTPPAAINGAPLVTSFTYRAQDARGERSEPATVTVTVSANQAPLAVNDSAATLGTALTIDVLANDSDPEGNTPLSIVGLTQPAPGQGTVSTNGATLTYTPPASITSAFTATFSYQAQDSLGAVSTPATVSVSVSPQPAAENLTVANAVVRDRTRNRYRWDLDGQTSLATGNTITVEVSSTSGPVTLGSATLTQTGRWRLSVDTTDITPSANPTATVRSAFGTVISVPLVIR